MYAQKITMVRPSVGVSFLGDEAKALQDAIFAQRAAHAAFVSSFFKLSEDGLVYTRVSLFTDKSGYWDWYHDSAAAKVFYDFDASLKKHMSEAGVSLEIIGDTDAEEEMFSDLTKIDTTKTLSENISGLSI